MFREKYRRDNELLKAPIFTEEDIEKMMNKAERNGGRGIRSAVIAAACLMIAAITALTAMISLRSDPNMPHTLVVSMGDMRLAENYDDIYSLVCELRAKQHTDYGYYFDSIMTDGAMPEAAEDNMVSFNSSADKTYTPALGTAPTTATANSRAEYSETNTQVEGVDEADIIKTDGRYIYRITGTEVVIIDAESMTVTSRITPALTSSDSAEADNSIWLKDMYIKGDRLAVMAESVAYGKMMYDSSALIDYIYSPKTACYIMIYDITDRSAPALISTLSQDGNSVSSRLVGDYIYCISSYYPSCEAVEEQPETFVPCIEANGISTPIAPGCICILPNPDSVSYIVMTAVNIKSCEQFAGIEAAMGYAANVYADTETILLTCTVNEYEESEVQIDGQNAVVYENTDYTRVMRFNINSGEIVPTGECTVPGSMLNQFSIDRYNGIIRVVTTSNAWKQTIFTDGVDRYEYESATTNGLYTLDEQLNILGRLDNLAEDERVYSVRFSGDIGYFVTFRQVDPLFAVDLSDPASPAILSALKIPGFSQYMHPYADGLLFGLGMDADEETGRTNGLKLSMFDVSDPTNVAELNKLIRSDIHWSEALYNHKAILINAERNIIAFPAGESYLIYGYGDEGFYQRFELDLGDDYYEYSNLRGLFIGNSFYICSDYRLSRYDMNSFEKLGDVVIADEENFK